MSRTVEFRIDHGDVLTFGADVVALKYAQDFVGVDELVARRIACNEMPLSQMRPGEQGDYRYVPTGGRIAAAHALFVGVVQLYDFGYRAIREFARNVLQNLRVEAPAIKHLAMTIHGVNYGLDEIEVLLAQFAGYLEAIEIGALPEMLECISIVDRNRQRVERLQAALEQRLAEVDYASRVESYWAYRLDIPQRLGHAGLIITPRASAIEVTGVESETKPHVFVAMPFKKDMDDVFYYGIQAPVRRMGFVCERVDQEAFTGDILDKVKQRIETSAVIIAELSEANPDVYLEVGYAWGKERPTILLVRDEQELRFDVRGQRCLTYERIRDLEEALTRELEGLKTQGII